MKHFALRALTVLLSALLVPGCSTVRSNPEARGLLLDCDYRIEDIDFRSVSFRLLGESDAGGRSPGGTIAKLRILGGQHYIFVDEFIFDVTTTVENTTDRIVGIDQIDLRVFFDRDHVATAIRDRSLRFVRANPPRSGSSVACR